MRGVHVEVDPCLTEAVFFDRPIHAYWSWILVGLEAEAASPAAAALCVDAGALTLTTELLARALATKQGIADASGRVLATADATHPLGTAAPSSWPVHPHAACRSGADLDDAEGIWHLHRVAALRAAGVRLADATRLRVAPTVVVAAGARLGVDVSLLGETVVGPGAWLDAGVVATDAEIGAGAHIKPYTVLTRARVGTGAHVGPFAHLRPGSRLDEGCHLGNFVETKNAHLAAGAKANHLAYLGDCSIGARANIGAGTITCNYDGARKHRTTIGEGAFVGTNSSLVAPVTVGAFSLVAAGSVVTSDVPEGGLALARAPQVTHEGKGRRILTRNRALKASEGS
jgi:bifunctional UDP-N-acetylglucosamine pyrophosphorylase/glucosamine-1-phosphate N-acetyltransferase